MKLNRLRTKFAALGFVLAIASAHTASAISIVNEYWVWTNSASANLGTLAEPYDASTVTKFDTVMNNMPANSTIHILPGTYQTGGNAGWVAKSGQKIIGSGIDVTTLKLTNSAPDSAVVVGSTFGSNIEVSDMTIDCNYTSGSVTYHGVGLFGDRNAIRRVKVIKAVGKGSIECFGFSMNNALSGGGGNTNNSTGNIIEQCEFSQFQGGGLTAIAFNNDSYGTHWISGTIRNNRIFLTSNVPDGGELHGINGCWMINSLIEGNYIENAQMGFHGDTGNYTNVIVAHNTFKNCAIGFYLLDGIRKNISVIYNNIELTNQNSVGLWFREGSGVYTNISVIGNNVRFDQGTSAGNTHVIIATNLTGFVMNNNTIDTALACYIGPNCSNVNVYDNFDLAGNPLTTLCGDKNQSRANEAPILGDFKNLIITNQVSDIVNKVGVVADEIILKNANGAPFLARNVALTLSIGTSGANGLDTGSQASSTWYYIWVIYDGVTVAGLLSTSATSPTMPADYDYKALVGAVRNNSNSDFIRFVQRDRDVAVTNQLLFTGITSSSGSTLQSISGTGSKTVELSTIVPTIAKKCRGAIGSSAGLVPYALVVSSDSTFVGSVVLYGATPVTGAYRNFGVSTSFEVLLSIPQDFYWMSSGNNVRLEVSGYSL